jgi:hypothetical protein
LEDAGGIEFDWDDANQKHLAAHKVTSAECEYIMRNDPLDLACQVIDGEERYRSVGVTSRGRLLTVVWTVRNEKVRVVTAFPVPRADRQAWRESR